MALLAVAAIPVLDILQGRRMTMLVERAARRSIQSADIDRLTGLDRAKFSAFIVDFTWWDELATYVTQPDSDWAITNLDSSYHAVKADCIWVFDKRLRQVYGGTAAGSQLTSELPFDKRILRDELAAAPFARFWVRTRTGLAEIRCGRIHYSNDPNRTGPFTGYLAAAHLWSGRDREQLSRVCDCDIAIVAPSDSRPRITGRGEYSTSIPLKDHSGRILARMRLSGVVAGAEALRGTERHERLGLIGFAGAMYLTLIIALSAWVNRPLRLISEAMASESLAPLDRLTSGAGEFSDIARRLHLVVEQKQQIQQDVDKLQAGQRALAESEERYRSFFTQNPVPCWVYDIETLRFVDVNDAALDAYGYSRAEFLGMYLTDIRYGEDIDGLKASLRQETGVRHRTAMPYRIRSGATISIDTTSIPMFLDGQSCRLVVAYDVTERVAAKARADALRTELMRSNRELQEFASVASHDLQEPLRKISAFGDRLAQRHSEALTPDGREYLDRMLAAAQRMQQLIEGLLNYSRVATRGLPFERVDLNEVLQGVLSDLDARIHVSQGRVESDQLPVLDADPLQMRQLFQNLIGNALKFKRAGVAPVVRITAEPCVVEERDCWRLTVADNGIGFEPEYVDRIFGVFERLHGRDEYEGTGIGLAIVRKLVARHGGTITAEGKPGSGAAFSIVLPARHEPIDVEPTGEQEGGGQGYGA